MYGSDIEMSKVLRKYSGKKSIYATVYIYLNHPLSEECDNRLSCLSKYN